MTCFLNWASLHKKNKKLSMLMQTNVISILIYYGKFEYIYIFLKILSFEMKALVECLYMSIVWASSLIHRDQTWKEIKRQIYFLLLSFTRHKEFFQTLHSCLAFLFLCVSGLFLFSWLVCFASFINFLFYYKPLKEIKLSLKVNINDSKKYME